MSTSRHLDIIRGIARSMSRATGIEEDELYGAAVVGYCETLETKELTDGGVANLARWRMVDEMRRTLSLCKKHDVGTKKAMYQDGIGGYPDSENVAIWKERRRLVRTELDKLGKSGAMMRRWIDGTSQKELAQMAGLTQARVCQMIRSARESLTETFALGEGMQ